MKKLNKNNNGFSLVELLVVIAIMVVLVGVIAPTLLNNIEKSREARDVQSLDAIAAAIQSSFAIEEAYDMATSTTYDSKVVAVGDLYTNADALAEAVQETLKTEPAMTGKIAKDTTKYDTYFYIKDGSITVFVGAKTPVPTDTSSAIGKTQGTKGTTYSVTR